jgi:hypothetical protein
VPKPTVPADVHEMLRERRLSIWIIGHPLVYDTTLQRMQGRGRHDMTRVEVQLIGQGFFSPWGEGPTTRAAVAAALAKPEYRATLPGVAGALARLELEADALTNTIRG